MPNYVFSTLEVRGENAEDLVLSLCAKDENGEYVLNDSGEKCFDFNKIIPMPESLNIIAGTVTEKCMKLYVNSLLEGCEAHTKYLNAYLTCEGRNRFSHPDPFMTEDEFWNEINRLLKSYDGTNKCALLDEPVFKTKADIFAYGKRALDNFLQYGAKDWYEWCPKHWGTKWNACECIVQGDTVWFSTAWNDVRELIRELSRQHPEYSFYYEYAEEEVGHYTGWAEFKQGKEIAGARYDDYTKEAYELAFRLAGGEDDYEYDEELGNYKPINED